MNEHKFDVDVSFRLQNILELNKRSIDTVDLKPSELEEIIDLVGDELQVRFGELRAFDETYRSSSQGSAPPVILIARMALLDQPYTALSRNALIGGVDHGVHENVLSDDALPYWDSVDRDIYDPQVHSLRGTDEASSGIWLGISEKE